MWPQISTARVHYDWSMPKIRLPSYSCAKRRDMPDIGTDPASSKRWTHHATSSGVSWSGFGDLVIYKLRSILYFFESIAFILTDQCSSLELNKLIRGGQRVQSLHQLSTIPDSLKAMMLLFFDWCTCRSTDYTCLLTAQSFQLSPWRSAGLWHTDSSVIPLSIEIIYFWEKTQK